MLDQLSKKNVSIQLDKTSNTKAKIMSIQTEVRADSKSAESSKQTKNGSTEKLRNENKKATHINSKLSTPLRKNSDNVFTKEYADNIENSSSISSRDINSKSKKSIVTLGDTFE